MSKGGVKEMRKWARQRSRGKCSCGGNGRCKGSTVRNSEKHGQRGESEWGERVGVNCENVRENFVFYSDGDGKPLQGSEHSSCLVRCT